MGSRTSCSPGLPPTFLATSINTSFCWLFISLTSKCYSGSGFTPWPSCPVNIPLMVSLSVTALNTIYMLTTTNLYLSFDFAFELCPWILVLYIQLSIWYLHLAKLLIVCTKPTPYALSLMIVLPWICSLNLPYTK